jgi:hypothetical protein
VYALVPLEALWANLHGSFPLGIALVLVFAFADFVERTLAPRDRRAQLARAAGVACGFAVAAWLATVEPQAFGLAAAAAVVAVSALFAVDGVRSLFDDAPAAGRGALRWMGIAAAMAGAVVLNPLGAGIYAFPFEFTATQNVITSTVNEWKPLLGARHLDGSLYLMSYWAYLALACGVLAIAAWRRRLGRLELGLLLAFGILPFRHVRWAALFALVTAPALIALLDAARVPGRRPDAVSRVIGLVLAGCGLACAGMATADAAGAPFDPWLLGALLAAAAAPGAALVLAARPRLSPRWGIAVAGLAALVLTTLASVYGIPAKAGVTPRRWSGDGASPGYGPSRKAMAATDFLRDAGIGGRLLTEYEWAGYAIHRLWPRVTVFIDSRSEVYGEALLAEFRRIKNLESAAGEALERHGVEIVLVRRVPYPSVSARNRGLLAVIEDDPRWGLLFVDDRSVLYARRDLPGELPAFLDGFAPHRFRPDAPTLADPELEAEMRRAVARAPRSAFLRFALASALRAQGRPHEALAELRAGWAANPSYAAVAQLAGEIAVADGEREQARRWFERAVEAAPNWPRARVALGSLSRPAE